MTTDDPNVLSARFMHVTDEQVEAIARVFHDRYEWWAEHHGWASQVGATPWDSVPERNRATMLSTVRSMLETDVIRLGEGS